MSLLYIMAEVASSQAEVRRKPSTRVQQIGPYVLGKTLGVGTTGLYH